jgi:hypothetical protein
MEKIAPTLGFSVVRHVGDPPLVSHSLTVLSVDAVARICQPPHTSRCLSQSRDASGAVLPRASGSPVASRAKTQPPA